LRAIVANGLDGTSLHGFLAEGLLVRRRRLFEDEAVAAVFIAREIVRRSLAAQIAIDALVVHVVLPRHILGIVICKGRNTLRLSVTAIQYSRAIGGFNSILGAQ